MSPLIRVSGHTSLRAGGIPIELRNVPFDKGKWTHFCGAGISIELRNVPFDKHKGSGLNYLLYRAWEIPVNGKGTPLNIEWGIPQH